MIQLYPNLIFDVAGIFNERDNTFAKLSVIYNVYDIRIWLYGDVEPLTMSRFDFV